MKAVNIAVILLLCSLTFVVANSLSLTAIIDDVIEKTENTDDNEVNLKETYEEIYSEFESKMTYISLTVNHEDLTSITDAFSELIGTLEAEDQTSFVAVKSRLISSLKHIIRLAGINIDSIL